ncbi:hypothetical protein JZ751_016689 [Albula glossodonta]|uniref:AIG1-type G domain-containing protein n=1 Tax=Albula glossodonta TaxID=121402 RepID=A0A8T2P0M9_9TELE|nr:hypothetical protein JZ751_016689 [Albula glossodonta]
MSSAGNAILGRDEFDTECYIRECVKRHGTVGGRQVTVVNTPGWWIGYSVQDPLLSDRLIGRSVSECPPGPHTFLIVIPVETLRGREWTVEIVSETLQKRVWRHAVVLFTSKEKLSETAIEQLIEREKCLQQIVEKCGNRYHVLNTTDRADGTQVTELLQKIEEMVAGNSGAYFLLDEALQELREKRRAVEERGKQRLMKVQKQRETLRALLMGESVQDSELRIVLLGRRDAGLRSVGNIILGREEFDTQSHTTECVKRQGAVAGRQATVVNTPGWPGRYDTVATPEEVKQEIVRSVSLFPAEPHALLLVIDVGYLFTETDRRAVEEHLELLGDRAWRHTMVLFTWGDCLIHTSIEQHIESWMTLQWLVDKCGNRYHVLNTTERADGTQVTELLQKVEEMVAGETEKRENERKVRENEEMKKRCEETERENEEMRKRCEEKEREKEKMEEQFRRQIEETNQIFEETTLKRGRELQTLKQRNQELRGEIEELKRKNKGNAEEISQLKEELSKLLKEKEESTAPVRNIVEMDLYMSGERIPGSTELMSQEEEDRQRDRDRQMLREEEDLRAQHQAEQEEWERRMREEMRRREESLIKPLEEKIQDLEERMRREKDEQRRRELEGELRREREQREKLERDEERRMEEEQKEMRERKERQRREIEALRQRYRQEAREDVGRYMIGSAVVLGAAIGAIAGALRGPLGAAAGTAIGAVAGAQLGAFIGGGQRDGGKRREERRSDTKQSTPPWQPAHRCLTREEQGFKLGKILGLISLQRPHLLRQYGYQPYPGAACLCTEPRIFSYTPGCTLPMAFLGQQSEWHRGFNLALSPIPRFKSQMGTEKASSRWSKALAIDILIHPGEDVVCCLVSPDEDCSFQLSQGALSLSQRANEKRGGGVGGH